MRTIRQTCALTGVTRRTLQEYDRIGLIHPTSISPGGYWMYDDESIAKITLIRILMKSGYRRREIKEIFVSPIQDMQSILENAESLVGKEIDARKEQRTYLEILSLTLEILGNSIDRLPEAVSCCEMFRTNPERLQSCPGQELSERDPQKEDAQKILRLFAARLSVAVKPDSAECSHIEDLMHDRTVGKDGLPVLDRCFGRGSTEFVMNLLLNSKTDTNLYSETKEN